MTDIQRQVAGEGDHHLYPIRVEMVSTEMPVHQLTKRGEQEIRIIRRQRHGGQVSMYWKAEPNPAVGRPGQLAYHLDTWVINRRLDEIPRPLPRLIRIGDLREIARELGQGGDTNAVKRAFEQNAATFIRAKLTYRCQGGGEETLEGYFNRYTVFYRGQALPGGRRAETVYISLNDPYYGLVNRSTRRPLDFAYLRQLPPAAQRLYELVSPRIFAAIKNRHQTAWMRYSDLCALAVLTRCETKRRMQIQLAAVHRPHVRSGYIERIAYRAVTADDGQSDWIIDYVPGPRARREFEAFNGARAPRQRPRPSPPNSDRPRSSSAPPRPPAAPSKATEPATEPATEIARRFAEKRYSVAADRPTRTQLDRARDLLAAVSGDLDAATLAVDLAARAATTDPKGFPGHLGGVLQGGFVERALALRAAEVRGRETKAARDHEQDRRRRHEAWCRQRAADRIAAMPPAERERIVDERMAAYTDEFRYFVKMRGWSPDEIRSWAGPRILERYVREDEPSFEAWCAGPDNHPTGTSGPTEALQ